MGKIFGNGCSLAFTSRLSFVVIAVGLMSHKSAAQNITAVTEPYPLLNSPVWKELEKAVYFIETTNKLLIKYNPETQSINSADSIGTDVEFLVPVIPVKNTTTKFAIGYSNRVSVIQWDGTSSNTILVGNLKNAFTDTDETIIFGQSDANHRLWVGTSFLANNENVGKLSSVDAAGIVTKQLELPNSPGGIAWSVGSNTIYYSDMRERSIMASSFDLASGKISNDARKIFDFKQNNVGDNALPAGMTVDITGYLWVACKQSGKVLKINTENGKLMQTIDIPASGVTSVAFGGDKLQDLYVTTVAALGSEDYPDSGSLFLVSETGSNGFYPSEIDAPWATTP